MRHSAATSSIEGGLLSGNRVGRQVRMGEGGSDPASGGGESGVGRSRTGSRSRPDGPCTLPAGLAVALAPIYGQAFPPNDPLHHSKVSSAQPYHDQRSASLPNWPLSPYAGGRSDEVSIKAC